MGGWKNGCGRFESVRYYGFRGEIKFRKLYLRAGSSLLWGRKKECEKHKLYYSLPEVSQEITRHDIHIIRFRFVTRYCVKFWDTKKSDNKVSQRSEKTIRKYKIRARDCIQNIGSLGLRSWDSGLQILGLTFKQSWILIPILLWASRIEVKLIR